MKEFGLKESEIAMIDDDLGREVLFEKVTKETKRKVIDLILDSYSQKYHENKKK